jgi:PilZ domain
MQQLALSWVVMSSVAYTIAPASRDTQRGPAERRAHKRVSVVLLGRFMRSSRQEHPCKLIDVSISGAAMMSPVTVEAGERVVAYFDQLGGIEGEVVRVFDGGFAIRMLATRHKREKIAALLTYIVNKHELPPDLGRRHERTRSVNETSTLKLDEGISVECKILDVSLSGASIETTARPPIGSEITFGKLRCEVKRHHDHGIGVAFLDIQEPGAIRKYFG